MTDMLDFAFRALSAEIDAVRKAQRRALVRSEFAPSAGAVLPVTLANAPLAAAGAAAGWLRYITDGRKVGEGVGAGTGVLATFDSATNAWLRLSDDTPVVI